VKAILHTQYGAPDLLQLKEVDKPAPKDNEVLIAIHATTVSTGDCNVRNFTFVTKSMLPIAKLMFGIREPWKARVLGTELAGEVERAGKDVTRFKTGDLVVASTGAAGGGHAQYACLPETGAVAIKPDSLSWEQAVAIPFGANTALYFLRDLGKIRAGQDLLIIGASGAIGSAGVQLAKHFGVTVTGVCSGANVELVKALGADSVIDYTRGRFHEDWQHVRPDIRRRRRDDVRRLPEVAEAQRAFSSEHHGVERRCSGVMDLHHWQKEDQGRCGHRKHGEHGSHHRTCGCWEAQAGHRQKLSVGADRGSLQVR
jgi:NADPH:quinone reductase-like Zn-dependent oxidoreductase